MPSPVVDRLPLAPRALERVSAKLRRSAGLLALIPAVLTASGTRVGFKDAFATARGNAFVATADNASAVYYNPAGLTQLKGQDVSATAYLVDFKADYTSILTGRTSSLKSDTQFLPQIFYGLAPANARWAVGLGYYAPFGLSTEWNNSAELFEFATKNKETYTTLNPVFAWRFSDSFSLGGGITFNHLKVDLNRGVVLGVGQFGSYRFNADGNDVGYNLGLRWQPAEEHAFGLSYQARTGFDVSGTSDLVPLITGEPARANFAFPEVVIAGYSYRPTPEWNIEADIDWTNWNRLKTVTITKASGPLVLPFNWKSSSFYELGATRFFNNGWSVSGGFTYAENSIPDATFTPALPDANRLYWNAGVGYTHEQLRVVLTLQRATASRTVHSGQVTLAGSTPDGSYSTSFSALSFSLDYRF